MPLKVELRKDTHTLWITGTVRPAGAPVGRRVRQRAGTNDPRLAAEEAIALEAAILRTAWHGERPSAHNFAEALSSYLRHEQRSPGTKDYCRRLLDHFREAPLGSIDQEAWDKARGALLRPEASPATVGRMLAVLIAILHHAAKRRWMIVPPFEKPTPGQGRTTFFMPDQAEALIGEGRHCGPLFRFLFCTGCRLGEALAMDWSDVDLGGARAILWEGETKGGKRRVVSLYPAAVAALAGLSHREGALFLDRAGRPYRTEGGYGGQVRKTWDGAMERAGLNGFTPHHARHSWASWFYAVHHDLLLLQHEGGWSSVELVARYAHLMPAGREEQIKRFWGLVAVREVRRA